MKIFTFIGHITVPANAIRYVAAAFIVSIVA